MEDEGAAVTCFEMGPNVMPDFLYKRSESLDASIDERSHAPAWFYFHKLFGSKNKATFGNIYALPKSLGRFDVGVVAAVLLHLANPFFALREIARITDKTIIITELHDPRLDGGGFMEFDPNDGRGAAFS
jgi:hypothetical protein